jgi:hypothetical protein
MPISKIGTNGLGDVADINSTTTLSFDTAGVERMRITSSGGVSFGASGTNFGAAGQTLISAGNAAPEWKPYNSVYAIPQTGDTAKWVYLGRWSNAAQDGRKLEVYINSSAGYNADIGQNQESYLYFKTSNGPSFQAGSSGNFFADGYVRCYSSNQSLSPSSIRVVQIDNNTYDFYGFFNTYTGEGSFYRVTAGPGTSWTNSSTIVGTTWTVSGNFVALPMMFTYYSVSTGQATPPPYYSARTWVNFNGTGTVAIRASGNVTSITDNGVGDYTVNFTTAMPDANYAVAATTRYSATPVVSISINATIDPTTSAVRLNVTTGSGVFGDASIVCVTVFR